MFRWIVKCPAGHVSAVEVEYVNDIHAGENGRCGVCRRWTSNHQLVVGVSKPSVKCSARCTSARRGDCECECVGRNHGSDHLVG